MSQNQYFYRLILDESFSFGCLGPTGRGLTEHTKVDIKVCTTAAPPIAQPTNHSIRAVGLKQDVEIVTVSMAYSLSSIGGLCIGRFVHALPVASAVPSRPSHLTLPLVCVASKSLTTSVFREPVTASLLPPLRLCRGQQSERPLTPLLHP